MPRLKKVGKIFPFYEGGEYFLIEIVSDVKTLEEILPDTDRCGDACALFVPHCGKQKLGRLVFVNGSVNTGLVVHECVHAAMFICSVFFSDTPDEDKEEKLAVFVEYLSNQAVDLLKSSKHLTGEEKWLAL